MSDKPKVAVVGAGWAGLAAAVELVDRGFHVEVFEASKTLGGRARSVQWGDLTIDNGQHILLGAYTETLRLMRKVGVDPDKALLRMPLTLWYPGEFKMVAPRLPAPFHTAVALATAQGLDWREKWAALRLMWSLKRANYRIEPDITVAEWLDRHQTPPRQRRLLWEPLCISALNTPAERASAQIMANVLRDSLGGPREASDMLIPRIPLSEVFPEPAAAFIESRGSMVIRNMRIEQVSQRDNQVLLHVSGSMVPNIFDAIIIAVAPQHVTEIFPCVSTKVDFSYEAITTCYVRFEHGVRLPAPIIGLSGCASQWLFDREVIATQRGLVASVISAHYLTGAEIRDALEQNVLAEVATMLKAPTDSAQQLTINEKRATFSCRPNSIRPANDSLQASNNRIFIAGDYTCGPYPGTIEGAVRSGSSCAQLLQERIA